MSAQGISDIEFKHVLSMLNKMSPKNVDTLCIKIIPTLSGVSGGDLLKMVMDRCHNEDGFVDMYTKFFVTILSSDQVCSTVKSQLHRSIVSTYISWSFECTKPEELVYDGNTDPNESYDLLCKQIKYKNRQTNMFAILINIDKHIQHTPYSIGVRLKDVLERIRKSLIHAIQIERENPIDMLWFNIETIAMQLSKMIVLSCQADVTKSQFEIKYILTQMLGCNIRPKTKFMVMDIDDSVKQIVNNHMKQVASNH